MAIYRYLKVSHQDGVCMVRFAEGLLVNAMADELAHEFHSVATLEDSRKVLMSFAGVGFLASGLFGKLLALHRRLQRDGSRLTLCEMAPQLRAVFSTMKLDQMLDIVETEAAALSALED